MNLFIARNKLDEEVSEEESIATLNKLNVLWEKLSDEEKQKFLSKLKIRR